MPTGENPCLMIFCVSNTGSGTEGGSHIEELKKAKSDQFSVNCCGVSVGVQNWISIGILSYFLPCEEGRKTVANAVSGLVLVEPVNQRSSLVARQQGLGRVFVGNLRLDGMLDSRNVHEISLVFPVEARAHLHFGIRYWCVR